MSYVRALLELGRADFLERSRRYGFLVTLAGATYLSYTVFAGWWTVRLGAYVPQAGPAWTGTLVAVATSVPLSLVGFYVVRGSVGRDMRTGVGPILASTATSRLQYTGAKFVSNLGVLGAVLAILVVLAVMVSALDAGRLSTSTAWQAVFPSLLLTAPMLVSLAGLAILFDTLPWLRGAAGSVAYFFLWVALLSLAGFSASPPWTDLAGVALVRDAMGEALQTARPEAAVGGLSVQLGSSGDADTIRFAWSGLGWNAESLVRRLHWIVAGPAFAAVGALSLRLFDPFRDSRARTETAADSDHEIDLPAMPEQEDRRLAADSGRQRVPRRGIDSLASPGRISRPAATLRLATAELRLLLSGHSWWWYGALACVNLTALAVPAEEIGTVLVVAWILPLATWSSLGCRDRIHGTSALMFSSPGSRLRQLPARWAAGIGLSVVTAVGPIVRLVLSGNADGLVALASGAAFVPALALVLGTWSGSPRVFEITYLTLWYLGPANGVTALDYMGATGRAVDGGATAWFTVAAVILAGVAWIGRRRGIRRIA